MVIKYLLGVILFAGKVCADFSSRVDTNIVLKYEFLNKECQAGTVADYSGLNLLGNLTMGGGTSCTTVEFGGQLFGNAANGVQVALSTTDGEYPSALKSAASSCGGLINLLNTTANSHFGAQEITFELWFELSQTLSADGGYTLFEFGGVTPGYPTLGVAPSDYGLKLTYVIGSGYKLTLEVQAILLSDNTAFSDSFGSGQSTFTATISQLISGNVYHLVGVLAPNLLPNVGGNPDDLSFYLNIKGNTFSSTPITTSGQNGHLPIGPFDFDDSMVLRVGTSYDNQSPITFPGVFYFFGIHKANLTVSQIQTNFNAGLPNAIPAALDTYSIVNENELSLLDINNATYFYDADGNPPQAVITSLPTPGNGTLYYEGVALTETSLYNVIVTDFTQLKFMPARMYVFDVYTNDCTESTSSTQFKYRMGDGKCTPETSLNCLSSEVIAYICVMYVNSPPVPTNDTSGLQAKVGSVLNITLTGTDPDSTSTPVGTYTLTTPTEGWISFPHVVGNYGSLFLANSVCNSSSATAIVINQWYMLSSGSYKVCYKTFSVNASEAIIGEDTFAFALRDSANLTSTSDGYFSVTVLNPLSTCNPSFAASSNFVSSLVQTCVSEGNEEAQIPIFLNGVDELGRSLSYEILELPHFGTLCFADHNSPPTGCLVGGGNVEIGSVVTLNGGDPNLFYTGDQYYANQLFLPAENSESWRTLGNAVIGGCSTAYTVCKNTLLGNDQQCCPDTIKFQVTAAGGAQSPPGEYLVFVTSIENPLVAADLVVPAEITVGSDPFNFATEKNSTTISLTDPDGDLYLIGFSFSCSKGVISMTPPLIGSSLNPSFAVDDICALSMETGCSLMTVSTYLSLLNSVLATMQYISAPGINNATDGITIKVFKPFTSSFTGTATIEKKIILNAAPTTSPTSASSLGVAIIAGASAAGFVVFVAFTVAFVWFCRKTHAVGKHVSQSVKRKMSQNADAKKAKEGTGSDKKVDTVAVKGDASSEKEIKSKEASSKSPAKTTAAATVTATSSAAASASAGKALSNKSLLAGDENAKAAAAAAADGEDGHGSVKSDNTTADGAEMEVVDDSIFDWEKHIDKKTGDVYFFNPKTGVSQWDPPTVKARRTKK